MKLLFKHILCSIFKSPLQPLLILLTVTLSVSAAVSAFRMRDVFYEHAVEVATPDLCLGDLTVTNTADSAIHLMYAGDAEAVVGDAGEVFGEYALSALWNDGEKKHVVSASAVDFEDAERYFGISYVEKEERPTGFRSKWVILSERFADEHDLSAGDSVELTVFGETDSYTVHAIAKTENLLTQRDILLSFSGVAKVLAKWIPAFDAFADVLQPCNRLMIRLDDPSVAMEVRDRLQSAPPFFDKSVRVTAIGVDKNFTIYVETMMVAMMALLIIVLSALLIATCLRFLQKRRTGESALFASIGIPRSVLHRMQLTESLLYAMIGAVLGLLLSVPMVNAAAQSFVWQTERIDLRVQDAIFGVLISVGLMLVCTLLSLRRQVACAVGESLHANDDRTPAKQNFVPALFFGVTALTLLLATSTVRVAERFPIALAAFLLLIGTLYCLTPIALYRLMHLVEKILLRRRRSGCLPIAVKNLKHQASHAHIARLVSVLLALLLMISVCSSVIERETDTIRNAITADVVAVNASSSLKQEIAENNHVRGVAGASFFSNVTLEGEYTLFGISLTGDAATCISPMICPRRLPQGNEAAITEGIAELAGVGIGDTVSVTINGKPYEFVISEILEGGMVMFCFNAEFIGVSSTELFCVSLADHAKTDAQIAATTAMLESKGAFVVSGESLFESVPYTFSGFLFLLHACVAISVAIALVGCTNVLYAQYVARRDEHRLLRLAGMTKRQAIGLRAAELFGMLLVAILLAAFFGGLLCILLDYAASSFGITMLS